MPPSSLLFLIEPVALQHLVAAFRALGRAHAKQRGPVAQVVRAHA